MSRFAQPAVASPPETRRLPGMNPADHRRAWLVGEVKAAWLAAGYPSLRRLNASLRGGAVVLRGAVPSFFLKQIAQEIALRVSRGETIHNEIDVAGSTASVVFDFRQGKESL